VMGEDGAQMRDARGRGGLGSLGPGTGAVSTSRKTWELSIYSVRWLTIYLIADNVHHARVRYVDFFRFEGNATLPRFSTHLGSVAYRSAYDISLWEHITDIFFFLTLFRPAMLER
jgi:hypothetical protein